MEGSIWIHIVNLREWLHALALCRYCRSPFTGVLDSSTRIPRNPLPSKRSRRKVQAAPQFIYCAIAPLIIVGLEALGARIYFDHIRDHLCIVVHPINIATIHGVENFGRSSESVVTAAIIGGQKMAICVPIPSTTSRVGVCSPSQP